jgi:hypothetical protein
VAKTEEMAKLTAKAISGLPDDNCLVVFLGISKYENEGMMNGNKTSV